ncbi:hypothetical protein [Limnobacter parvus]|uniref:Uncharacterized protein n=1 Tax=Limnobacter parvus TaxID=2939690 RepID=A0ABT1XJQ0_9BURK|nr:hypothetical protein [Limnobacter parvus]MCR2747525.1 hypothetical protein [Limnobacter parvus]
MQFTLLQVRWWLIHTVGGMAVVASARRARRKKEIAEQGEGA